MVDNIEFHIIPNSNPDGYVYTHTNQRMWRKTRKPNGGWCVGADPNRNWYNGYGVTHLLGVSNGVQLEFPEIHVQILIQVHVHSQSQK